MLESFESNHELSFSLNSGLILCLVEDVVILIEVVNLLVEIRRGQRSLVSTWARICGNILVVGEVFEAILAVWNDVEDGSLATRSLSTLARRNTRAHRHTGTMGHTSTGRWHARAGAGRMTDRSGRRSDRSRTDGQRSALGHGSVSAMRHRSTKARLFSFGFALRLGLDSDSASDSNDCRESGNYSHVLKFQIDYEKLLLSKDL